MSHTSKLTPLTNKRQQNINENRIPNNHIKHLSNIPRRRPNISNLIPECIKIIIYLRLAVNLAKCQDQLKPKRTRNVLLETAIRGISINVSYQNERSHRLSTRHISLRIPIKTYLQEQLTETTRPISYDSTSDSVDITRRERNHSCLSVNIYPSSYWNLAVFRY